MIIVTHDPEVAAVARRNIHLKDGVVEFDTFAAEPAAAGGRP